MTYANGSLLLLVYIIARCACLVMSGSKQLFLNKLILAFVVTGTLISVNGQVETLNVLWGLSWPLIVPESVQAHPGWTRCCQGNFNFSKWPCKDLKFLWGPSTLCNVRVTE